MVYFFDPNLIFFDPSPVDLLHYPCPWMQNCALWFVSSSASCPNPQFLCVIGRACLFSFLGFFLADIFSLPGDVGSSVQVGAVAYCLAFCSLYACVMLGRPLGHRWYSGKPQRDFGVYPLS